MHKIKPLVTATLFILCSYSHSGYKILSHDYIVSSGQIKITFNPSLIKESAKVSFQPCGGCEWLQANTQIDTEYYDQYERVTFKRFRENVKSFEFNPPKSGYKALISIDKRNNEIFNIKWNYVEL